MPDEDAIVAFYDADRSSCDQQRWTSRAGARTNPIRQRIVRTRWADWNDQRILEVGTGTVVGARCLVEGELPGWMIATGEPTVPRRPRVVKAGEAAP